MSTHDGLLTRHVPIGTYINFDVFYIMGHWRQEDGCYGKIISGRGDKQVDGYEKPTTLPKWIVMV